MSRGFHRGRGSADDGGYQEENHPIVAFRIVASVEQFQVYLEVGFEGVGQTLANVTSLGGRAM